MENAQQINGLENQAIPGSAPIAAIRADLAAWSAGQSPKVQGAVRNLDGWLAAAERGPDPDHPEVVVVACLRSAVETLRRATGRA